MIQTQIELTETQATALEELAVKRQLGFNDLILEAIEKFLETASREDAERRQRALAVIGLFEGPEDLAENHDDYLIEAYSS